MLEKVLTLKISTIRETCIFRCRTVIKILSYTHFSSPLSLTICFGQYLYLYLKSMKLHFLLWLNICNNIFDNISFNNPPFIVHLWRLTHRLSCSDRSRIVKLSKNASKYHFLLLHPAQRLSVTTFTLDHFYSINANMVFFTQHSQSDRQQVANFVYILYMVWLYVAPFSGQIWTTNVSDINLWTN